MIKQYIFLREDLPKNIFKTSGTIITQACHCVTAVIFKYIESNEYKLTIKSYLSNLKEMTKVVLKLDIDGLKELESELNEKNIGYFLWNEDSEDVCIATVPLDVNNSDKGIILKDISKKYKLFNKKI